MQSRSSWRCSSQPQAELVVLEGAGNGTFRGPSSYRTGGPSSVIVLGDFYADGVEDVAVMGAFAAEVSILPSEGAGRFGAPISKKIPAPMNAMAAADLDGNALVDLGARGRRSARHGHGAFVRRGRDLRSAPLLSGGRPG
jgi:hypothetical protein